MSEDLNHPDNVNYQENWEDEATQCKNCQNYQEKEQKKACVPEDMTFEKALEEYGEISATSHCNYFQEKK